MTTDTNQQTEVKQPIPFGTRLKSAREAMGLERKDAAQKLHLSEKIILMMEKDRYPADLPVTFIRGYLRSYSKLLQIPEHEIRKGIEPIKPKPTPNIGVASTKNFEPVNNRENYFMHIFTFVIILTMIALVCMWWYSHSAFPSFSSLITPSTTNAIPNETQNFDEKNGFNQNSNKTTNQDATQSLNQQPTTPAATQMTTTATPTTTDNAAAPTTTNNASTPTMPSSPADAESDASNAQKDRPLSDATNHASETKPIITGQNEKRIHKFKRRKTTEYDGDSDYINYGIEKSN